MVKLPGRQRHHLAGIPGSRGTAAEAALAADSGTGGRSGLSRHCTSDGSSSHGADGSGQDQPSEQRQPAQAWP